MSYYRSLALLSRLFLLASLPLTALSAQGGDAPSSFRLPPPSISASGHSEVRVTPDRATIRISVQSRASTAAVAASDNANLQTSVINSLQKQGLSNKDISTADYTVEPNYRYSPNKAPVVTGYTVTNTIIADIHNIGRVGEVIDAAISSGANLISSLEFYASNTSVARSQAIVKAVENARTEADAAARGAGGTLGGLLDLNIGSDYQPPPRPVMMRTMAATDAAAPTPISPGEQTLTVTVFTRWLFLPRQTR